MDTQASSVSRVAGLVARWTERLRALPLTAQTLIAQVVLLMLAAAVLDYVAAERLRQGLVLGLGLGGLLSLFSGRALIGRALGPLPRLARFAREMARGEGGQVYVRAASREIVEMAEALNDTAATMQRHVDALGSQEAARLAMLNAVPDVLIGLDAECRVRLTNHAITSVFGVNPEEALGMELSQLLPGLDAAEAEQRTMQGLYMRSTRTHVARFEIEAQRQDGTPFPAEISLSRIETPDGAHYALLVRDTTEQRMTFAMMNLYSRALECTTNGIVISDMMAPGTPVFYANPAFYNITGYERGEAIGRNCKFLQRDDTAQPEIAELRQAVAEGRAAQVVLRNYKKDGTLFFNELAISPVIDAGQPIQYYVGVVHDVTERERARMAIAERSARLNAVFDLSPDGFVVFDREGQLVYCNRALLQMTGWASALEVQGLSVAAFDKRFAEQCDPLHPARPLAEALASVGDDLQPDTLHLQRPTRRVLARVSRSARNGHAESILFFRDITRETEVDRMKSEFLTTAAHELRTPMVSVFGFTELLLQRPVPEAHRRDVLETIHRQAALLIRMVNELLDLARIEARQGKDLKRAQCGAGELVKEAVAAVCLPDMECEVITDLVHADAVLFVDPAKSHQALVNVLSNAVKYSPGGGTIVISTQRAEIEGSHGRCQAIGLRIADQGIGMSPEQLERVFERFYRADPSGNIPGTGLGMSLVKEIVELQGGRVDIDSEPERGTRVTLWLPLAEVAAPSTAPAALQAPSARTH